MENKVGIIVIGRNEGERLKRCLQSLLQQTTGPLVYVDSGSTDGSVEYARARGIETLELDMSRPFNMARARNAGFRFLKQVAPATTRVQFMDGDCEVNDGWLAQANALLDERPDVAAVCGDIRERFPEASIYNRLFDLECREAPGSIAACGGPAMYRASAFNSVGGFHEEMIAGEEAELCLRLRRRGFLIWRSPHPMALHDADMHRFGQWWTRTRRCGYAYAHGFKLHGLSSDRHNLVPLARCIIYGLLLPTVALLFLLLGLFLPAQPELALLGAVLPAAAAAKMGFGAYSYRRRLGDPSAHCALYAASIIVGKVPEALGALKFLGDSVTKSPSQLIEYRGMRPRASSHGS